MSVLGILDLGPSLIRYWTPTDGSDLPVDPLEAVTLWLDDIRERMAVFSTEPLTTSTFEVIGYDYISRKWRCLRVGVRKERL